MPFYYKLDSSKPIDRRIATNLLSLKQGISKAGIPDRSVEGTLLIGTWNIREFGNSKMGLRSDEPLYYIAEIISRFDLVAVQEVKADVSSLKKVMDILGNWWKFIVTDVTAGSGGNNERMAFVYDSRKLSFNGLAGEVVLPPDKKEAAKQLARTPFIVGFQSGWFKFTICTAHIYYGQGIAVDPQRRDEIKALSNFLADQAKNKYAWAKNMILLGDFNIFDTTDITFKAITDAGFVIPQKLQHIPGSNVPKNKHYDQIAFITPGIEKELELCEAGVFDYYEYIYKDEDEAIYAADLIKKDVAGATQPDSHDYKTWRTFQMSDHLPMWIQLKTDFGTEYLRKKQ